MKRLKSLRTDRDMTQQQLADMLNTTQQTIARWETGKALPSVPALRDLATIFSTSVDDLLGQNLFSEKIVTNSYYLFEKDNDGFWGHLGLRLKSEDYTFWYPITSSEYQRLWRYFRGGEENSWFVTKTLNNRMLAFQAHHMNRTWLLDDACDEPKGDWQLGTFSNDYQGLPREVYSAMSDWAYDGAADNGDFIQNNSTILQNIVLNEIRESGMEDKSEKVIEELHYSKIFSKNGEVFSYEVEPDELWSSIQDIELGLARMLYLPATGSDFESFFPIDQLVLIDMPLSDIEKAAHRSVEELAQS